MRNLGFGDKKFLARLKQCDYGILSSHKTNTDKP
jgi:hypothetical protein